MIKVERNQKIEKQIKSADFEIEKFRKNLNEQIKALWRSRFIGFYLVFEGKSRIQAFFNLAKTPY